MASDGITLRMPDGEVNDKIVNLGTSWFKAQAWIHDGNSFILVDAFCIHAMASSLVFGMLEKSRTASHECTLYFQMAKEEGPVLPHCSL